MAPNIALTNPILDIVYAATAATLVTFCIIDRDSTSAPIRRLRACSGSTASLALPAYASSSATLDPHSIW